MIQDRLDSLQCAYKAWSGTEDVIATLLNIVLMHLEGIKKLARLLFNDFSSAFNCIPFHTFAHRLLSDFNLDLNIVCCLIDSGSPQGCVCSPLLFVLYTHDCQTHDKDMNVLKFGDDKVIDSLWCDEEHSHGPVMEACDCSPAV